MKKLRSTLIATLVGGATFLAPSANAHLLSSVALSPSNMEYSVESPIDAYFNEFNESLTKHRGSRVILDGTAELNVPDGFYFIDASDTSRLMEETTGFPAEESVVGMILPDFVEPLDSGGWRVLVSFDAIGRVNSSADSIDADAALEAFRETNEKANEVRELHEFSPIELTDWAATPTFDEERNALSWGVDLIDFNRNIDLVDYRAAILGREGVLRLEMIASGFDKPGILNFGEQLTEIARFSSGARYHDFTPGADRVAEAKVADFLKLGWAD